MTKKSAMRIGAIVFVLILLIGIITAVGKGSSWFRNWDVRTWYNAWGKNNNGETVAISSTGEKINAGGEYKMPQAITVMPLAVSKETGQYVPSGEITLIANLSNEFIQGTFEFSSKFTESGTGWETDKNVSDYLQVTPSGSDTVKLKVLAAFGAPIELTATLQGSDSAATCKIDYLKKPNEPWNSLTQPTSIHFEGDNDFGVDCYLKCFLDFGMGTVSSPELEIKDFVAYVNPDFQNAIKKYLTFEIQFKESGFESQTATALDDGAPLKNGYRFNFQFPDHSMFIKDFENYSEQQKNAVYYAWYEAYQNDIYPIEGNAVYPLLCRFSAYVIFQGNVTDIVTNYDGTLGHISGEMKGKDIQPDTEFNTNIVF